MELLVVRKTRRRIPTVSWQRLFSIVQRQQRAKEGTSVALVLETPQRMAFLNQAYHGGHGPTDVLAFPADQKNYSGSGDIVICPSVLGRGVKAREFAWLLAHRFVHAQLHLHGYQHNTPKSAAAMEAAVQRALRLIPTYGRNYPKQH